jgi:uncharacterized membrane-anchored protein
MNASHVTVGTGAISATAWLTTLLTGFHGLDGNRAAAAAGLICFVIGGIGMALNWYVQRKWPTPP